VILHRQMERKKTTVNKNILFYIIAFAIFILLKFSYTQADAERVLFLLKPTDRIVRLITNSSSVFIPGSGFFNEKLNIVIEKSCSGFNFWMLCFLMLTFSALKFMSSNIKKAIAIPVGLFVAYLLTVFSNASRIILSMMGQNIADNFMIPRPHLILHSAIGTFIYLFFLIIFYLLFNHLFNKLKPINEKPA